MSSSLATLQFHFSSVSHGHGTRHACHNRYVLGDRASIEIESSGKYHFGTLQISFTRANGEPCSLQEWAESTALEKFNDGYIEATRKIEGNNKCQKGTVYRCCQLKISLSTHGRKHQAVVRVEPLSKGVDCSTIHHPKKDLCSQFETHYIIIKTSPARNSPSVLAGHHQSGGVGAHIVPHVVHSQSTIETSHDAVTSSPIDANVCPVCLDAVCECLGEDWVIDLQL